MRWSQHILVLLLGAVSQTAAIVHDKAFHPDYILEATEQDIQINCQTRRSVVINGTSPGPTIHLREGHTSWIRVYNRIPDKNFTVHWHGLSQRTAPFSDGTPLVSQWPIPPSHFFDYEIKPEIGDAGSYFYHSHVGFQRSTAHGALIVQDAKEAPYKYARDITLTLGDYYPKVDNEIESGLLADPFKWSGEPEAVVVNGKSGNQSFTEAADASCAPLIIDVDPGKVYRLRVIGTTAISLVKLGIEGHPSLDVIEADGEYTKRASVDHLQVAPGQRFSYLLETKSQEEIQKLNQTQFWIRYETRERPVRVPGYALLRYSCLGSYQPLPTILPPLPPVQLPNSTVDYLEYTLQPHSKLVRSNFPKLSEVTRTVTIKMTQVLTSGEYVNGTLNGTVAWVQNGHSWHEKVQQARRRVPYLVSLYVTSSTTNYTLALENDGFDSTSHTFPALPGEVLDIVWENESGVTGGWDYHPMHVHGEHVYDLGSGNGTYNAASNEKRFANGSFVPARRDTTNLYRYAEKGVPFTTAGWRAWRIRVTEENVGAWMMHCHVAQHAVMGMNTVWIFGDQEDLVSKYPQLPYVSGYLDYGGDAYGNETKPPTVEHWFTD